MTQTRFFGHIHSIVGNIIMVSPKGDDSQQERCLVDDFESMIPMTRLESSHAPRFCFNVKRDRIAAYPYHNWLGNEGREETRMEFIEKMVAFLVNEIQPKSTPEFELFEAELDERTQLESTKTPNDILRNPNI